MKKIFALILAGLFLFGCLEQTPAPTPSTAAASPSPTIGVNATVQASASPTHAASVAASQTPSATTHIPFPSVAPKTPYCVFRLGGDATFEGPKSVDISAEFFYLNETNATLDCGVNSTTVNISEDTHKAFRTCDFPVYSAVKKFVLKATAGTAACNLSITITATKPPSIINLKSEVVDASSALITWMTSRPTTTNLEYGIGNYAKSWKDNESIADHSALLYNLTSNSSYQFRVTACDQFGLCKTSPNIEKFQTPE